MGRAKRDATDTALVEAAPYWSASSLLLLALAVGVLTGLGEWLFLEAQRVVTGRIVFLGRHAAWMKPLSEGLLFFALAGLLVGVGRVWSRARSLRVVAFLVWFLGIVSLLLLVPPLHWAAKVALALGGAAQLAGLTARWLGPREHASRRVAIGLAVMPLLLASVWVVGGAARERLRTSRLAEGEAGAPNVLLLILDTVRAQSLSLYDHPRPTTPELERIAREGVRFDGALAPAPWTLPSHASMFTGRPTHELTADWRRPLDETDPTLAGYLAEHGYLTAGFVANMGYCGWETGLARGFQHYEDHPIALRQLLIESAIISRAVNHPRVRQWVGTDENFVRKSAADVNRRFLGWLDSRSNARPFFAFLNYYDAHGPYMPPEPYRSRFATGTPRSDLSPLHRWNSNPFGPLPPRDVIRQELDAYEASIAYLDARIGELIRELRDRDVLDNTVLVITSDHGEEFGEHGVYDHGNSLYLEGLRVPLIIRYPPRTPAGRVVPDPVDLADLPATIVHLAGLEAGSPFPGESLAPAAGQGALDARPGARGGTEPPPARPSLVAGEPVLSQVSRAPRLPAWFPVSRGDMKSLADERWHYILNGDGGEELYDLSVDPRETVDLAARPESREVLARFRRLLPPTTKSLPPETEAR